MGDGGEGGEIARDEARREALDVVAEAEAMRAVAREGRDEHWRAMWAQVESKMEDRMRHLSRVVAGEEARADAARHYEEKRAALRRLSATQGVVTRTRQRVGHGVCPCCKRSFAELRRHMQVKHPDYAKELA